MGTSPPAVGDSATRYSRAHSFNWYHDFGRLVQSVPQLKGATRFLPSDWNSADQWSDFYMMLLKHTADARQWENGLARVIDFWQARFMGLPELHEYRPAAEDRAAEMAKRGWCRLGDWPKKDVDILRETLSSLPALDSENCDLERPVDELREDGRNIALIDAGRLAQIPEVFAFLTAPDAIDTVLSHMKAWPTLINLSAWWSFATSDQAREAQLFHFDQDDFRFCKVFLYLTDVDEESGPHQFVPRTHDQNYVHEVRTAFGPDPDARKAFDEWYFSQLRKSDEEVERHFQTGPDSITGPAGSRIIVNTRGIHRGLRPTKRDRLIVQGTFGISQRITDKAAPASFEDMTRQAPLDTDIANIDAWRHMLRLYWS